MNAYASLREFAIRHQNVPVLSLYVRGGLDDPSQRRAWLVAARDAVATQRARLTDRAPAERAHFEQLVSRVLTELPSDQALHQAGGWMGLAADDEVLAQSLAVPCATRAIWQTGPAILPYVAQGLDQPVFVLQIDREHAALMRLHDRSLDAVARFEVEMDVDPAIGAHMGDAPTRGFHQGTRGEPLSDHAQRRMNEARRRLQADTLACLARVMGPHCLLLVSGPDEVVAHFMAERPVALAARSMAIGKVWPTGGSRELVDCAVAALPALRAQRDAAWFHEIRERSSGAHASAFGVQAVRDALAVGAIERLVMTERFLRDHPLISESLALGAMLEGADVSIALPSADARIDAEADGIVASLRFAAPRPAAAVDLDSDTTAPTTSDVVNAVAPL